MKKNLLRGAEVLLAGYWIRSIAGAADGVFHIPEKIGARVFRTEGELTAMVLIFFVLLLLFVLLFSLLTAWAELADEAHAVRTGVAAGLSFLFYLYACLYAYPLLDNHFTTAWLMTGKYTATLIRSLLELVAGVFSRGFHWNDTLAWYGVSACVLVYPFVLLCTLLGGRNFFPVLMAALLPSFAWLVAHWCRMDGGVQMVLGASASLVSALLLHFFTDGKRLGTEARKPLKRSLLHFKIDGGKRIALLLFCAVLWIATVYFGRVRSFGAVMALIFSSKVYFYQSNLYALADTRVAQTLAISYVLSLLVRKLLSLVELEDHSKLFPWLTAAYMLLLQIWVLPLLSRFMSRAADRAQGTISTEAIKELRTPAEELLTALEGEKVLPVVLLLLAASAFLFFLFWFCVRLPFARLAVWFLVWFSVCTYVYCLIGLYYRSVPGNLSLLFLCYGLDRLLEGILTAGQQLRKRVSKKE